MEINSHKHFQDLDISRIKQSLCGNQIEENVRVENSNFTS